MKASGSGAQENGTCVGTAAPVAGAGSAPPATSVPTGQTRASPAPTGVSPPVIPGDPGSPAVEIAPAPPPSGVGVSDFAPHPQAQTKTKEATTFIPARAANMLGM